MSIHARSYEKEIKIESSPFDSLFIQMKGEEYCVFSILGRFEGEDVPEITLSKIVHSQLKGGHTLITAEGPTAYQSFLFKVPQSLNSKEGGITIALNSYDRGLELCVQKNLFSFDPLLPCVDAGSQNMQILEKRFFDYKAGDSLLFTISKPIRAHKFPIDFSLSLTSLTAPAEMNFLDVGQTFTSMLSPL